MCTHKKNNLFYKVLGSGEGGGDWSGSESRGYIAYTGEGAAPAERH